VNAPDPDPNVDLAERYARRGDARRYHPLQPDVWHSLQERQRAMVGLFARAGWADLGDKLFTELGCGDGGSLLELLRLGARPEHLTGVELLPERFAMARGRLPDATRLWLGDALQAPVVPASQQMVLVFTVFSSLLDDEHQQRLARMAWSWLAPGGAVLCYDFAVDNPRNPDVRGVPTRRLRQLFPQGRMQVRRVTLAPPLARRLCRWHPALYPLFNSLPLLRTHRLAWIEKPA
jgi:SAM-dependent methyltransferase